MEAERVVVVIVVSTSPREVPIGSLPAILLHWVGSFTTATLPYDL